MAAVSMGCRTAYRVRSLRPRRLGKRLVDERRDVFLPEVAAALTAFESRQLAAQPGIERTAEILLKANEAALARRYLTEQANSAAGDGLRLIEALAESIEARTKVLYGIRTPDDAKP